MKQTDTLSTKIDPYKLAFPTELDSIKPKWVVPLPGKHEARIYDDFERVERLVDVDDGNNAVKKSILVAGYRIDVTKSNGVGKPAEWSGSYGYGRGSDFCETLLDLKLTLEHLAVKLAPKTTTSTRRTGDDEEE